MSKRHRVVPSVLVLCLLSGAALAWYPITPQVELASASW
jgi:hypothetical protein